MAIKRMKFDDTVADIKAQLETLNERRLMRMDTDSYVNSAEFARRVNAGLNPLPATSGAEYAEMLASGALPDQADAIDELIADLPDHLGSRLLRPHPVRIGIIADQFLYSSLEGLADLVPLTPGNWRDHVDDVDLFMITSAWRGLNQEWFGLSRGSWVRRLVMDEMVPVFRDAGVPIVYYSKEDPPNFDVFLPLATVADHVYTTADTKLKDYRKKCSEAESFGVMSFGVNPFHHNPVGSRRRRLDRIMFAGSWHRHKYQLRRKAGTAIFQGILDADRELIIFDRNFDLGMAKYAFPHMLMPHIAPSISHERLLKLQRITDISVNLNSVVGSMTMYANRVVELQAMGAYVISNYNAGVNDRFPTVFMAESAIDVAHQLQTLDPERMYRAQMAGLRTVFSAHTAHRHLGAMLDAIGLPTASLAPRVAVTGPEAAAREFCERQSLPGLEVLAQDQLSAAAETADVVIPVSEGVEYGLHHAEDLLNGFVYTDSDFITKSTSLIDGEIGSATEHDRVSEARPELSAIWVDSPSFGAYIRDGVVNGLGYAVDPFEFALAGSGDRALPSREPDFEDAETAQPRATDARLSVIVPVYNNGRYLRDKCFSSLRRSSIFSDMEILLVDDGSTDPETVDLLARLSRGTDRVRWLRNAPGGSGSASRPRNQGLAAASAEYVTYLDPDNEAVNDGFARLFEMITESGVDFAIGDMSKRKGMPKHIANAKMLKKYLVDNEDGTHSPTPTSLADIRFTPMSIQALVANTEWLRSLGLTQPVGAVGQDSYFFQQMLYYARRIQILPIVIHVYYAAVSTSTVNTISPNFFRKYLPLEKSRSAWLREVGLMDEYVDTRYEAFLKGWHLPRLKQVLPEDYDEAVSLLQQINDMYDFTEWTDEELRTIFGGREDDAVTPGETVSAG